VTRPDIPVVPLREAARILGVSVEAAKSSLRHHGIRSGYPLDAVQWLATNRPGRGARTDKKETTVTDTEYGTLTDYTTGEELRPATRGEWLASLDAGETGAFKDVAGRAVFVAGGPETVADDPAGSSADIAAITLPDDFLYRTTETEA